MFKTALSGNNSENTVEIAGAYVGKGVLRSDYALKVVADVLTMTVIGASATFNAAKPIDFVASATCNRVKHIASDLSAVCNVAKPIAFGTSAIGNTVKYIIFGALATCNGAKPITFRASVT